jgi:hypothetical protein
MCQNPLSLSLSLSLSFIKDEDWKVEKVYRNVRVCTHSLVSLKSENR